MDLKALHNELANDPLGRGYAQMTDAQAAASLNSVANGNGRPVARSIIPAREIIEATAPAEWGALSAAEKQRYQTITGAGDVDVRGANTRAAFLAMFGAGTATRAALAALQNETVSRAVELGIGNVRPRDVALARGGRW